MLEKLAKDIAESVKKAVKTATDSLLEKIEPRLKSLETSAVTIETLKANLKIWGDEIEEFTVEKAKQVILESMQAFEGQMDKAVDKAVADKVAALPPAAPGQDGKSVTLEDVAPLIDTAVKEAFAAIPAPKDGESVDMDVVKATIEAAVKTAVAAIPAPAPGKDADPAEVEKMVKAAVAEIPPAKDGKSVSVEEVAAMVAEQVAKAVAEIKLPEPKDGRDALDIEIMPAIDEEKSYPRGLYATHRGGLWKSWKQTKGMVGWECIVDGVFKTVVAQEDDRNFNFIAEKSSGSIAKLPFYVPAMVYKRVYQDGKTYKKGDTVTWAGSMWHCDEDTTEKPGDGSKHWTLAAKRGRDGNPKVKV